MNKNNEIEFSAVLKDDRNCNCDNFKKRIKNPVITTNLDTLNAKDSNYDIKFIDSNGLWEYLTMEKNERVKNFIIFCFNILFRKNEDYERNIKDYKQTANYSSFATLLLNIKNIIDSKIFNEKQDFFAVLWRSFSFSDKIKAFILLQRNEEKFDNHFETHAIPYLNSNDEKSGNRLIQGYLRNFEKDSFEDNVVSFHKYIGLQKEVHWDAFLKNTLNYFFAYEDNKDSQKIFTNWDSALFANIMSIIQEDVSKEDLSLFLSYFKKGKDNKFIDEICNFRNDIYNEYIKNKKINYVLDSNNDINKILKKVAAMTASITFLLNKIQSNSYFSNSYPNSLEKQKNLSSFLGAAIWVNYMRIYMNNLEGVIEKKQLNVEQKKEYLEKMNNLMKKGLLCFLSNFNITNDEILFEKQNVESMMKIINETSIDPKKELILNNVKDHNLNIINPNNKANIYFDSNSFQYKLSGDICDFGFSNFLKLILNSNIDSVKVHLNGKPENIIKQFELGDYSLVKFIQNILDIGQNIKLENITPILQQINDNFKIENILYPDNNTKKHISIEGKLLKSLQYFHSIFNSYKESNKEENLTFKDFLSKILDTQFRITTDSLKDNNSSEKDIKKCIEIVDSTNNKLDYIFAEYKILAYKKNESIKNEIKYQIDTSALCLNILERLLSPFKIDSTNIKSNLDRVNELITSGNNESLFRLLLINSCDPNNSYEKVETSLQELKEKYSHFKVNNNFPSIKTCFDISKFEENFKNQKLDLNKDFSLNKINNNTTYYKK